MLILQSTQRKMGIITKSVARKHCCWLTFPTHPSIYLPPQPHNTNTRTVEVSCSLCSRACFASAVVCGAYRFAATIYGDIVGISDVYSMGIYDRTVLYCVCDQSQQRATRADLDRALLAIKFFILCSWWAVEQPSVNFLGPTAYTIN